MPDTPFSLIVDRSDLGLTDLDLNDHVNYYVASQFLGGQVAWNRSQVTSPFIDGAVTTYRNKQMVTDAVTLEVMGSSYAKLMTNINAVVAAFTQDTYNLQLAFNTSVLQYACEAADYTVNYDSARWVQRQVQIVLSIPRQPDPVIGGF